MRAKGWGEGGIVLRNLEQRQDKVAYEYRVVRGSSGIGGDFGDELSN